MNTLIIFTEGMFHRCRHMLNFNKLYNYICADILYVSISTKLIVLIVQY